jgi:deazaflavin-dependent oxidoreductase (nitroreductase family)
MIGVLDHLVNPVVRAVLRSPAHRLLSGSVMLLTYTGRRTGRRRTIPVMYARGGGTLLVNVGMSERKRWWRNLRGGAPVEVLVQRRAHRGAAEVITADQARAALGPYLARFPRAARVNDDPESLVMVRIRIETRPKCSRSEVGPHRFPERDQARLRHPRCLRRSVAPLSGITKPSGKAARPRT